MKTLFNDILETNNSLKLDSTLLSDSTIELLSAMLVLEKNNTLSVMSENIVKMVKHYIDFCKLIFKIIII